MARVKSIVRGFLLVGMVSPLVAAQDGRTPEEPPVDAVQIRGWISDLESADAAVVVEASRRLREFYSLARYHLVQGLRLKSPDVRWHLVRILVDARDAGNYPALERVARADGSPRVRILALKSLSRMPEFPIVELLCDCVQWEEHPANRLTILSILRRVKDKRTVGPLIQTIQRSLDKNFCARAFRTLQDITGARLPDEIGPWKAWWDVYQAEQIKQREKKEADGTTAPEGATSSN